MIWFVTTAGGLFLFLLMLRRSRDEDSWAGWPLLTTSSPGTVSSGAPVDRHLVSGSAPSAPEETSGPPRAPRLFDTRALKGIERAKVGYRHVRMSSKPDIVRSTMLGRLERGDEVEIVDSYEGFLQIRTPDGTVGWIQRHTIVGGAATT